MRITFATARRLICNYKQNHWPIINGACPSLRNNPFYPNVEDSRSVWFNLNELQDFINAVRNAGGNGIRFYFGEYSADVIQAAQQEMITGLPAVDADCDNILNDVALNIDQYVGMQTIVMVPTTRDAANTMNCDFSLNPKFGTQVGLATMQDNSLSAMNHGGMAPPPFDVAGPDTYAAGCGASFLDF